MNSVTTHHLSLIKKIHFFDEIGSTNDLAIELSSDEGMHGTLVVAKRQTKARGRKLRQWVTALGDVAMSLLVMKSFPSKGLHLFTISTALAMIKTLSVLKLQGFIKWPNDVVILHPHDDRCFPYCGNYRKIGGILTETIAKGSTIQAAIIGVGINIKKKHNLFLNIPHAIGVEDLLGDVNCEQFLEIFLPYWDELLTRALNEQEHNSLMTEYRALCITLNTDVTINDISGRVIDIGDDGAIVVQNENAIHKIYGGELTPKLS